MGTIGTGLNFILRESFAAPVSSRETGVTSWKFVPVKCGDRKASSLGIEALDEDRGI